MGATDTAFEFHHNTRSAALSDAYQRFITEKIEERARIKYGQLEMLAAAFLMQTRLDPAECELVEQTRFEDGQHVTTYFFRRRPDA